LKGIGNLSVDEEINNYSLELKWLMPIRLNRLLVAVLAAALLV